MVQHGWTKKNGALIVYGKIPSKTLLLVLNENLYTRAATVGKCCWSWLKGGRIVGVVRVG